MHFRICVQSPLWWRRACLVFLALFWCAGIFLGIYAASSVGYSFLPLMRAAIVRRVSIVALFAVLLLPFLLSAFVIFFSQPWLLLLFSFFKAFSFGFCCSAAQLSFGSAGWLVCLLLLFSDICTLPVLYWFWVRHISGDKYAIGRSLAVSIALVLFFGSLDYCFISPFLSALIIF